MLLALSLIALIPLSLVALLAHAWLCLGEHRKPRMSMTPDITHQLAKDAARRFQGRRGTPDGTFSTAAFQQAVSKRFDSAMPTAGSVEKALAGRADVRRLDECFWKVR